MPCIEARGLRKAFDATIALDGVDLRVEEGRILGLIGPNGAGKTTALNAILGLTSFEGELRVLGRNPWTERDLLMRDVCFIADVAVLPRWMRVWQLLDYVAGVHPRFDRAKAEGFLARTEIKRASKVRQLSKGMVAQLHLALVMAIDARLLVLDEPTLGLDILYRKQFYDSLLNDYFDKSRTIIVTTHQVEELQHVLTDLMFINPRTHRAELQHGRIRSALLGSNGASGATTRSPGAQADSHPPGLRSQHHALRQCRSRTARHSWRSPYAKHSRLVRSRDEQQCHRTARGDQMTTSNAITEVPNKSSGSAPTQPFYWSVRRELWENKSIYIGPLIAARRHCLRLPGQHRSFSAAGDVRQCYSMSRFDMPPFSYPTVLPRW